MVGTHMVDRLHRYACLRRTAAIDLPTVRPTYALHSASLPRYRSPGCSQRIARPTMPRPWPDCRMPLGYHLMSSSRHRRPVATRACHTIRGHSHT